MIGNFKGLTDEDVVISRKNHGDNSLVKEKTKGFLRKFFENLSDPIIKVLLFAVFIEIIFTLGRCNWLEVGGIITAVLIATMVSTVSEHGSEKAFLKMSEENGSVSVCVIRNGKRVNIPIYDVVVGDILCVCAGESVSADGEMIYGRISVNQSALNGEGRDVVKSPLGSKVKGDFSSEKNVARGSVVTEGEGLIRVEKVGKDTYYGMIAKDVQSETRESPLKLRLSHLASQISKIGYFMAFLVGITYLYFTFIVGNGFDLDKISYSFKNLPMVVSTFTHALTLMITVIVVAVPEGLPMMITVVLSANMKKMLRDNIMVKKLVGIETAGSMNILFTDKTGTLTTGKMTVEEIITCDNAYKNVGALRKNKEIYHYLNVLAFEGGEKISSGINATDKAIFEFFKDEAPQNAKVKEKSPFNSDKKLASITLSDQMQILLGAPEIVTLSCSDSICSGGSKERFDSYDIMKKCREHAAKGERIVAAAVEYRGVRTFIAIIVLKDKIRKDVRVSIEKLHSAGIKVVMITGDSRETAVAIAKECGIMPKDCDNGIITHDEMEKMSDDELKSKISNLYVVARALPRDKSRLVKLSQDLELVVGMTGDGINDAPSLKLADVGFAMGSGTDIAKGAGDIVILDDSLGAIAKTVLYGRTIFKSIRKFISFQLMMNLTACGVSLLGQFIGIENPITIIQMLWINIIMDTLGGLAFAAEPPMEYYMLEKPKRRDEKILSKEMLNQILLTGAYTLLLCVLFLAMPFVKSLFRASVNDVYLLTGFYALFVFSGIFNCFNTRSERLSLLTGIGKNKPFLIILSCVAIIQLLMIYFGGTVFRSVPLSFREVLNVILLAATVIPFDALRRIIKKLS